MTTTMHRVGGSKGANGYGEYQVRHASDKQQLFLKTLLEIKEHSFGEIDIPNLNVQGAGDLISRLLSLPNKAGVIVKPSEKQVAYAQALSLKKEGGLELLNQAFLDSNVNTIEELSKEKVSQIINGLRYRSDKQEPIAITEVGAYLVDEVVYSIRLGNESRKWQVWSYNAEAKKYLRESDKAKEGTVMHKAQPTDRLTLELAIKYSAHTGLCVHCGRTLTLLKSVAGGMGAICAKKYH